MSQGLQHSYMVLGYKWNDMEHKPELFPWRQNEEADIVPQDFPQ